MNQNGAEAAALAAIVASNRHVNVCQVCDSVKMWHFHTQERPTRIKTSLSTLIISSPVQLGVQQCSTNRFPGYQRTSQNVRSSISMYKHFR